MAASQNHQTLAMITDWIFHPFQHLEGGGHTAMHHEASGSSALANATVRRFIFLRIETSQPSPGPDSDFDINVTRIPYSSPTSTSPTSNWSTLSRLGQEQGGDACQRQCFEQLIFYPSYGILGGGTRLRPEGSLLENGTIYGTARMGHEEAVDDDPLNGGLLRRTGPSTGEPSVPDLRQGRAHYGRSWA